MSIGFWIVLWQRFITVLEQHLIRQARDQLGRPHVSYSSTVVLANRAQ
jgi:hypothetical protein